MSLVAVFFIPVRPKTSGLACCDWKPELAEDINGRLELGLAFAKHLPSQPWKCALRKGLGMPNYEGKVPENADVVER